MNIVYINKVLLTKQISISISANRYIEVFLSSADEVRAYSARMEGGFRSTRGYRPTPYDRNDRFGGGGRFGGRGRGSFGKGEFFMVVVMASAFYLNTVCNESRNQF